MAIKSRLTEWLFPRRPKHGKRKSTFQPAIESLEDRMAPAVFTVSNNGDAGTGSLRQAIINANSNPGLDTIRFSTSSIPLLNGYQISLQSSLPVISSPVIINGSQITFLGSPFNFNRPMVEIIGTNAGNTSEGIHLNAGASGSSIRGLVINRFGDDGIAISGSNMVIQNCWIGVSFNGTSDAGNSAAGIRLIGSASNNLIGGTAVSQRNVISGQAVGIATGGGAGVRSNNTIQGNFIGTNVAGSAAIGNNFGIFLSNPATNTLISNNVISGNTTAGVTLDSPNVSGMRIENNLIGVAADGVSPMGNGKFGVFVAEGSHDNTIGGLGAGNTIAFNGQVGVLIGSDPTNVILDSPAGVGNRVLSNTIFGGAGIPIDLGPNDGITNNDISDVDVGPNNLQNVPLFFGAGPSNGSTLVAMDLSGVVGRSYAIQMFHSNNVIAGVPQDMTFVSTTNITVTTTPDFVFNITMPAFPVGSVVWVTATDLTTGDTSEMNGVTISNTPPMIRNDVLTPDINEGQKATLSGNLVDPDPGDELSLIVNWGDGSPVQTYHPGLASFAFQHRYVDNGTYNVNFTWIDNHGASNTRTRQVVVHNVAPDFTNVLAVPKTFASRHVALIGQFVDPGLKDTFKITVDWGDGTVETFDLASKRHFSLGHRYSSRSSFTIKLTLLDDDGGTDTLTRTISVR